MGCALSHFKMWEDIANNKNMNDEDFIIILEDDGKFVDNFQSKLNSLLDQLKFETWDVCYFGYTDYIALDTDKEIGENLIKLSGNVRIRGGGTFGYLINKIGAKKLYKLALDRCIQQAIDWFMIEQYGSGPDKIHAYKTKNDLIFSKIAGVDGHDSDIQKNRMEIFYDIKLEFYKFKQNLYFKDQYNNLFTIDEPFKINYIGNLIDDKQIQIKKFHKTQAKTKLTFIHNKQYIALYVGKNMKIFIHYLAKYIQNKLNKNIFIFYDGYDLTLDNVKYINIEKFEKLNDVLKYSHIFLFDILLFVSEKIQKWNKIIIFEDGQFFYNNAYENSLLPNYGTYLFQNIANNIDKVISISDTSSHYFKCRLGLLNDIEIFPPIFGSENADLFKDEDKMEIYEKDVVFISYDTDVKSILNYFHSLNIFNKKLIIFSDFFKATNSNIIIKPFIYRFNFSYLNYATFFITESRLTDNYYATNLALKKGIICIISSYYRELNNKTITFLENLRETKERVENCITNKVKIDIYKKIGISYIKNLDNKLNNNILFN